MKEKMKRIIAGLLLAGLVVSGVPAAAVYAEEGSTEPPVQTQETNEAQNEEPEELAVNNIFNKEAADDETSAQEENVQEEPAQEESAQEEAVQEEAVQEEPAEDAAQEEAAEDADREDAEQKDEVSAGTIDFVYIEKPYLTTPDTQRIVVAFDEGISGTDEIALTVEDESGSQTEWPIAKEKDGLYLFEKEFTGEAYTGTYQAVSLQLGAGDGAETVDLAGMDIRAEFGVNEEYDGYDELQPMDEEAAAEDAVEASVVTIDENGVTEAQNDIADALNTAGIQTAGISTFSRAASRSVEPRTGNIVIALDPGHDSRSPGASANGLKEEVLTLKIAKYCKAELEKYDGVEIYMTRTDADCPFDMSGAGCIEKRVNAAADAGAQIYVSFHLNSSTSSTPKGAEVIIQNKNWRPDVAEESEALAEKIMDELVALGLSEREIYYRNSEAGEKYADGSSADYFSVHRNCKLRNIPGIIIEHAFLTNSSDVNSFLKTEAGLKKLGVADAKGIVKYLGLDQGQWKTDAAGNRYFYVKGAKVTGEYKIGNAWYYFDPEKDGAMVTGLFDLPGKKVYYNENGQMQYGEQKINGQWYYFKPGSGAMQTGLADLETKTVYYASNGRMQYGEQKINGYWYYFKPGSGAMQTGLVDLGTKTVYYASNGQMQYGEQKINGYWYYFKPGNGAMQTGLVDLRTKTVYYASNGRMQYGEQKINGYWYYFKPGNGAMQIGLMDLGTKTVYYASNGRMQYGEQKINGYWYYFKPGNGAMQIGLMDLGTKMVYYSSNGQMQYGEQKINGHWYYFKPGSGAMQTGLIDLGTKMVYYASNGQMQYGEQKINGHWYYFKPGNGAMQTGVVDLGSKTVYYDKTGKMVYGERVISGHYYFFKTGSGAMVKSEWYKGSYYNKNGQKEPEQFMPIIGKSEATVDQLMEYYSKGNIAYPEFYEESDAPTLKDFCTIYYEEAEKQGVRAEVAFVQAMKETNWLKYGHDVKIEQYNFAGLGATGGGERGASFDTVREGIRAQIQHLYAYASSEGIDGLAYPCVDPRFVNVSPKGGSPYVEWLGQSENPASDYGWAVDETYGLSISKSVEVCLENK